MKKFMFCALCFALYAASAEAYQMVSTKELGRDDAKNQNVIVKCTTDTGKVTTQICQLRRYAKCAVLDSNTKRCDGWLPWQDIRNPSGNYADWRSAAVKCCADKGLK